MIINENKLKKIINEEYYSLVIESYSNEDYETYDKLAELDKSGVLQEAFGRFGEFVGGLGRFFRRRPADTAPSGSEPSGSAPSGSEPSGSSVYLPNDALKTVRSVLTQANNEYINKIYEDAKEVSRGVFINLVGANYNTKILEPAKELHDKYKADLLAGTLEYKKYSVYVYALKTLLYVVWKYFLPQTDVDDATLSSLISDTQNLSNSFGMRKDEYERTTTAAADTAARDAAAAETARAEAAAADAARAEAARAEEERPLYDNRRELFSRRMAEIKKINSLIEEDEVIKSVGDPEKYKRIIYSLLRKNPFLVKSSDLDYGTDLTKALKSFITVSKFYRIGFEKSDISPLKRAYPLYKKLVDDGIQERSLDFFSYLKNAREAQPEIDGEKILEYMDQIRAEHEGTAVTRAEAERAEAARASPPEAYTSSGEMDDAELTAALRAAMGMSEQISRNFNLLLKEEKLFLRKISKENQEEAKFKKYSKNRFKILAGIK